ncbi:MAG: protein kinase [Lentisphaeria bacterium]|nr:protein kinase [Lentisphaeria bacterium]
MKSILIVDDEKEICEILKRLLRNENHIIFTAQSGEEGLEVINSQQIDLLITDIVMPGISGIDLLKAVRKASPTLPVIMISGHAKVEDAVKCFQQGAIDFITKPFNLVEIKEKIDKSLDSQKPFVAKQSTITGKMAASHMIGEYELKRIIGEGASGIVYMAIKNDQKFAVKVFKNFAVSGDRKEACQRRFIREAKFLDSITNPNIIHLYDYGFTPDNLPYIVMNYIQGKDLKRLMNKDISNINKCWYLEQLANALDTVHKANFVHRDIKPANMMIDEAQNLYLTDFDIVANLNPDSDQTQISAIKGSPAYLAPECFSDGEVTAKADIYSMGVVAYELFTGQKPFVAKEFFRLAEEITTKKVKPPIKVDSTIHPDINNLILVLMEKDPKDRTTDAYELKECWRIIKNQFLQK